MQVPFGFGTLDFPAVPQDFSQILEPSPGAPAASWESHRDTLLVQLRAALEHARPQSVALLVEDKTRKNRELPSLLTALVPCLQDIPERRLVVAYGTHTPHTAEEHAATYGPEALQHFRVVDHHAKDGSTLVPVGTLPSGRSLSLARAAVEADFRIVIGSIEPHVFAGFTGGRKMILPGIASHESIRANHAMVVREFQGLGNLIHNPIHEEMDAAAALLPIAFAFQFVRGSRGEVLELLGGDLDACFKRGVARCIDANTVALEALADLTVVTPGGHPKDASLYQSNRAITAARLATRPGGTVVVLASFHQGVGHPRLEAALRGGIQSLLTRSESQVDVGDHNAVCLARNLNAVHLRFHTEWPQARLRELGLEPLAEPGASLAEAWHQLRASLPPGARTCLIPNGSCVIPRLPTY